MSRAGRGWKDRAGRIQSPTEKLGEHDWRVENLVHYGQVEEVDYDKSLARVRVSDTRVSNWIPWQHGMADAGNRNSNPIQVGAQVAVINPSGDPAQGFILPGVYRNAHPNPTPGDPNQYLYKFSDGGEYGYNRSTHTFHVDVNGVIMRITPQGIAFLGGTVTHNGKNIGDTHVHGASPPPS